MKNGKRPTVRQCQLMKQWKLNPEDWLVIKDTPDQMELVHRWSSRTRRVIPKRRDEE